MIKNTDIRRHCSLVILTLTGRFCRSLLAFSVMMAAVQLNAQVTTSKKVESSLAGKTTITWFASFPNQSGKSNNNFFKRLGDIVLGEQPPLLSRPVAVTAAGINSVYIADQGRGEIILTGMASSQGISRFNPKEEKIASIAGLCILPGGKILFTDSGNNGLFVKSARNNYLPLNDSLKLEQPTGVAWSPIAGEIWVIETKAHCITVLDQDGIKLRSIGKRGTGPGEFNFPTHIWIDDSGMAYITDAMNFRVQLFNNKGEFILCFGKQGDATGYFARPKGVATDSRGNIYVADALLNSIQVFDHAGKFMHYFGIQGSGREEFWMPNGIFIDKEDFLYIADSYNSRIQVFKIENR